MSEIVEQGEGYKIYQDTDTANPRTEWEQIGKMICWHRNYSLGDVQPKVSPIIWLEQAMCLTDSQQNYLWKKAKRMAGSYQQSSVINQNYHNLLMARFERKNVVLPLYLYDHSGITMKTTPFECQWDSGQVGLIYVPHATIKDMYGSTSKANKEKAKKYLIGEVITYDQYLTGDVYYYALDNGDTCGGYYGLEACREAAQEEVKARAINCTKNSGGKEGEHKTDIQHTLQ